MDLWPDGNRLALSLVVNVEEGAERSLVNGDKGMEAVDEFGMFLKGPMRSHPNESNYAFGIRAGARRILSLLDDHAMPATWTACGLALEKAPWLAEAIVRRGDEIASHGYRWQFQHRMERDEERDYIARSTDAIEKVSGQQPVGWLSRYYTTDSTRDLLCEAGYLYHMDDFSDERPFMDESGLPIVVVPYQLDTNDMKLWSDPGYTPRLWAEYLIDSFDFLHARAGSSDQGASMLSVGVHLRIAGRPGRAAALESFLRHVRSKGGCWIATRREIAEHFKAQAGKEG